MATSLFKLVGSIFVDADEANKSLQKTTDNAEKTGVSFKDVASKAGAIGAAVGAAATAAVAGMVNLATQTAATADVVDKAAKRMDISSEEYQRLAYAAGLAGVETSTLESAAKKLEGTGINFDDAIDSIMALETAEERSAAAAELFGDKIAYTLSPMIEQTAEDFYNAKQEADDLGLVLSGDTVEAGAQLNDTLSKIQQSFSALITKLGVSFLPIVEQVGEMILTYMPQIQGVMDGLIPVITDIFSQLLPPLMELVDQLFPILIDFLNMCLPLVTQIISDVMPIIISLFNTFAPVLMTVVQKLLPPLLSIIEALLPIVSMLLEVFSPILDVFMELLDPIADLLTELAPLITMLLNFISAVLQPLMPLLKLVAQILGGVLGGAIEAITWLIKNLIAGFNMLLPFFQKFQNTTTQTFTKIADFIKNIFEKIKTYIKEPLNWIIDKINGVFSALGSIKIPSWVPSIGGTEFKLPQIPRLANGGILEPEGQLFQARENGAELVGSFGNKTAVMNNDQIVESVSRGVAQAVASVFSSEEMASAIVKALQNSPMIAQIAADDVFTSVRNSNKQYIEMTGKSALA